MLRKRSFLYNVTEWMQKALQTNHMIHNITEKPNDPRIKRDMLDKRDFYKVFHKRYKSSEFKPNLKTIADEIGVDLFTKFQISESVVKFDYLMSYLDVCIYKGNIQLAKDTLLQFTLDHNIKFGSKTIELFNMVLHGLASEGNWEIFSEFFSKMEDSGIQPNLQSYCAAIECNMRGRRNKNDIKRILERIDNRPDLCLEHMWDECTFVSDQLNKIMQGIQMVIPHFCPKKQESKWKYDSCVANPLISRILKSFPKSSNRNQLFSLEELRFLAKMQLDYESKKSVSIENIETFHLQDKKKWQIVWDELETFWRKSLMQALKEEMHKLDLQQQRVPTYFGLYPYLSILEPEEYMDIMIQELLHILPLNKPPLLSTIKVDLGNKIMKRYFIHQRKKNGIMQKFQKLYEKYCDYYCYSNLKAEFSPRMYWELLKKEHSDGPSMNYVDKLWPKQVLHGVGLFFFEILRKNTFIDVNLFNSEGKNKILTEALTVVGVEKPRVKRHAFLGKLYNFSNYKNMITFESAALPMISPPLPWTSFCSGGFLTQSIHVIRYTDLGHLYQQEIKEVKSEQLQFTCDALNSISSCPWKINEHMLDLIIHVFTSKEKLVSLQESKHIGDVSNDFQFNNEVQEGKNINRILMKNFDRKERMDLLCALTIANKFRKQILWIPHNVDFRGRVYPCTEYLKYFGTSIDDVLSSLFLFANGEELGEKGLKWLKIHLVNLTGSCKNFTLAQRLQYCNEIISDVIDSARHPFTGKKWWMKSENPWQTLACCIELTNSLNSSDPHCYVCHLPVHQDSSNNVLQHYAALGRDENFAELVNLLPTEEPRDMYSQVAEEVEKERKKDAARNGKTANLVKNIVTRDLMKPYVIYTAYGNSQDEAVQELCMAIRATGILSLDEQDAAASYLAEKASGFLQSKFSRVAEIQEWLHKIAVLIIKISHQPIRWVSPLGFPVIQPHSEKITLMEKQDDIFKGSKSNAIKFVPNAEKQRKAFPPNYIHSLESSHMMLTALQCYQHGIPFASIHDCFWTLPSTVDIMNKIIREEFVLLHSQPLLRNLATYLEETYLSQFKNFDPSIQELKRILNSFPSTGKFDLNHVLESTYFFH